MPDREKLIELIRDAVNGCSSYWAGLIADNLIDNGIRLEESKRIEELEAKLAEREEVVCNLRKKWDAAETHICTMCGHFDHKTDGNIVYGYKNCGELVGYPCCGKFTPWIPVSERLPEDDLPSDTHRTQIRCLVATDKGTVKRCVRQRYEKKIDGKWRLSGWEWNKDTFAKPTHWMPLPEPPKGEMIHE